MKEQRSKGGQAKSRGCLNPRNPRNAAVQRRSEREHPNALSPKGKGQVPMWERTWAGRELAGARGEAGGVPRRFTLGTHWYKESPRIWRIRIITTLVGCVGSALSREIGLCRSGVLVFTGGKAVARGCRQSGSLGAREPRDFGVSAPTSCSPPRNPPPRSPRRPGSAPCRARPFPRPRRVPALASAAPPPHRVY